MANGIADIRRKKRDRVSRPVPPPRHPLPDTALAQFTSGEVSAVPQPVPDPGERSAPPVEPYPADEPQVVDENQAVDETADDADADALDGTADTSDKDGNDGRRPVPDLTINWSDPLMHVATPTRVSVAGSVAARFKAAAEQPNSPPHTQLIMEAVSDHLDRLPELVLARRPEEQQSSPGFFLRRAAVASSEPWVPIYMRPNTGEVEALRRLVDWVTEVITKDHPGRKKSSRSELVTAALDATYPA